MTTVAIIGVKLSNTTRRRILLGSLLPSNSKIFFKITVNFSPPAEGEVPTRNSAHLNPLIPRVKP
jgi:hypothetical protein